MARLRELINDGQAERKLDLLMNRLLLVFVGLLALGSPASAQWGGGGAQVGATAYCASRAAGKNHDQAARAANNALVNSMGGNFSSNIATIVTGGSAIRDSMLYLVKQQCPDLYYGKATQNNPGNSSVVEPESTVIPEFTTPGVIGIQFSCYAASRTEKSDHCIVLKVLKGSPADQDGRLRGKDRILEVNGKKIRGVSVIELGDMVGGEVGTYVTIVIDADGEERPITLKRVAASDIKID